MKSKKSELIRKIVKKNLKEVLIGGLGFNKNDIMRLNLFRNEASLEVPTPSKISQNSKDTNDLKSKQSQPQPIVQLPTNNEKSGKKTESEKPKSKDFNELRDEVTKFVSYASELIGDADGDTRKKILDKLYDEVDGLLFAPVVGPGLDIDSEMGSEEDADSELEEPVTKNESKKKKKK